MTEPMTDLSTVLDDICRLRERALTGKKVTHATWKIWEHCRNNQSSLDSEQHCAEIESVIRGAVSDVQKRCEALSVRLAAAEKALKRTVTVLREQATKLDQQTKLWQPKAITVEPDEGKDDEDN